ncbi:E3 ubiquitin-protein ligase rnf213-alpha isoform X2 [Arachis ipaensis]|uniref:E3 ubiquitin-protein ligase rnf213-alpha isoform X2 n=1 Tax=Arachis ipaensis TaxID=130454 RepID=UPI000A2B1A0E|nr:E3 ubiquitin-protein ligase rnf213-alpha isoform X2 [Arachis ipaensis]XP_025681105.1 E3 ubiquitin-protein ligase rnf213-alpha isoform X2 [Arachis hypogaea]
MVDSPLKTSATMEELKLPSKQSLEGKEKEQGEAAEHSSVKNDTTAKEINPSRDRKRWRKKEKKQGEAAEHKGYQFSVDISSVKKDTTVKETDAPSEKINSSPKPKRERKEKKPVEAVEHKDQGPDVSLGKSTPNTDMDNEFSNIDATREDVSSSSKRKRKRKKKKQEKAVEDKGPRASLDKNSQKIDDTAEDSLNISPALPNPLGSQDIVECSSKKRNKRRKRQKTKYNALESIVNTNDVPKDTFSSKFCTPALHMPSEHPIQFGSTDSIRGKSCAETNICQQDNDKGDQHIPIKEAENTNGEHVVQDISRSYNSKNKLLILDMNGLLADFAKKVPQGSKSPDFKIYGGRKGSIKVFKRPFCDEFIQFCLDRFHVGVWSSRKKKKLGTAVNKIFGESASKLLFRWDQSHCTKTGSCTLEDKGKPIVFKELRKLWEKVDASLPWKKGEFNESNTLLLDDSPYKALLNPRNTAIFPNPYHFDDVDDTSLGLGSDLHMYLEGLAGAENVQEYVASHPFGQEAITETHRSWNFYRKVIEAVKRNKIAAQMRAMSRGQLQSSTVTGENTVHLLPAAGDPPQEPTTLVASATDDPQLTKAPPPPTTRDPLQLTDPVPLPSTATAAMLP